MLIKIIHLYSPSKASKDIKWAMMPYLVLDSMCLYYNPFYNPYWSPPTLLEIFLFQLIRVKDNNATKKEGKFS